MTRILVLIALLVLQVFASGQVIVQRDPLIRQLVNEVSADSLRSYVSQMVSFGTRHTLSTQSRPDRGIGAARNWVLQQFRRFAAHSGGRFTAFIDTVTLQPDGRRIDSPVLLGNVIGRLQGTDLTDPRVLIISGHLDSRNSNEMDRLGDAPGANDDASGVAAVIECARILSRRAFPITILFVAFSGEEQGLLGAHFMAEKARKEKWQIEAVLNNDIMGSNNSNETNIIDNTRIRVFSEGLSVLDTGRNATTIRNLGLENDGRARQLARYVKEIGERYVDNLEVIMIYRNDRFLRGGDHTPFVLRGYPAVRFSEMNENYKYQHQDVRTEQGTRYGDLLEFMDFEYLRKNTGMNLANLANLASAPPMPREVLVDTRRLTNSTTISWNAPASGRPKGYYILVRETTSPVWQKKIFTTDTRAELPFSKDNYFFAVQSVSAEGNESLPVMPVPAGR